MPRAYGDFRDYRDVGGGLQALIPTGCHQATIDPEIADKLASDRLSQLQEARRSSVILGVTRAARLGEFVEEHLRAKESEEVTYRWLKQTSLQLHEAIEFFGADRTLASIKTSDIRDYVDHLARLSNGRRRSFSGGTVRHYLNSLGNMFRRAVAEEVVNGNPVAALLHKPTAAMRDAEWLEVPEAARLLEASRDHRPNDQGSIRFLHQILATFLLTGGRSAEVLGLRVQDINLERETVTFSPNEYRRLKTRTSKRTIPLWPQLREVLDQHIEERAIARGNLLFPSPASNGHEEMIQELRRQLDVVGLLAGFPKGRIRTRIFRHTYCSARLQTLDNNAPVSVFTVARELGHSSSAMVERVYSHLGRFRHRTSVVEYRVANPIGTSHI